MKYSVIDIIAYGIGNANLALAFERHEWGWAAFATIVMAVSCFRLLHRIRKTQGE